MRSFVKLLSLFLMLWAVKYNQEMVIIYMSLTLSLPTLSNDMITTKNITNELTFLDIKWCPRNSLRFLKVTLTNYH